MSLFRFLQLCALAAIFAGCKSMAGRHTPTLQPTEPGAGAPESVASDHGQQLTREPIEQPKSVVGTVSYEEETLPSSTTQSTVAEQTELSLPWLIEAVQARNPSLQAMAAVWEAAAARYPQAVSLEDPMFMAMAAPASFGSDEVESAYALQLNQK